MLQAGRRPSQTTSEKRARESGKGKAKAIACRIHTPHIFSISSSPCSVPPRLKNNAVVTPGHCPQSLEESCPTSLPPSPLPRTKPIKARPGSSEPAGHSRPSTQPRHSDYDLIFRRVRKTIVNAGTRTTRRALLYCLWLLSGCLGRAENLSRTYLAFWPASGALRELARTDRFAAIVAGV
ncbi:hypothetical protein GQ53DRAFT_451874 [Thozetella sp. PMI_491]|nr:hypothetical protein GQ53DRAFT_451874 [Thozetella sp. PMI_491]